MRRNPGWQCKKFLCRNLPGCSGLNALMANTSFQTGKLQCSIQELESQIRKFQHACTVMGQPRGLEASHHCCDDTPTTISSSWPAPATLIAQPPRPTHNHIGCCQPSPCKSSTMPSASHKAPPSGAVPVKFSVYGVMCTAPN